MATKHSDHRSRRRDEVVAAAKAAGFLQGENSAVGARVPQELISRAKTRSGISSTTDLLEYALAKVALEDDFGVKLVKRKGAIPPDIALDL